jgi:hypothetical protein
MFETVDTSFLPIDIIAGARGISLQKVATPSEEKSVNAKSLSVVLPLKGPWSDIATADRHCTGIGTQDAFPGPSTENCVDAGISPHQCSR